MPDMIQIDKTVSQGTSHGVFSTRAELALHGVYEISKILAVPTHLEATLSNVLMLLSSFLDMRHGLIALMDEKGEAKIVVGSGWVAKGAETDEASAKRHFERLPERAIGRIVATKMPLFVEDVAKDPLFAGWEADMRDTDSSRISFIGVPIKDRDRVIGTLTIDRVRDGATQFRFDEDVRFLVMIANLVGQTVRLQELVVRDRERLMTEQRRLEKELADTARPQRTQKIRGIVGESPAIHSVLDKINIVARSNSTVLLRGESGTGKELFARAIHDLSPRQKGPFVKLNCAALSETMLESELFGHEKGAFTGAVSQHRGRFELAHGGTLFLDEIGEISPAFQAKLLRVLQEGEFERVGGSKTLKVSVRLVTATNKNLEEAVAKGEFRADLYYRINVVSISLPALREREGDVSLLAGEFLRRFNDEHHTKLLMAPSAKTVLESCYFPGNVRELENCVRRTATLTRGPRIEADDFACRHDECLSATLWRGAVSTTSSFNILPANAGASVGAAKAVDAMPSPDSSDKPATLNNCPESENCEVLRGDAQSERERLVQAMETAGWVQAKAARLLNMTPRQIGYALRKHNIAVKKF